MNLVAPFACLKVPLTRILLTNLEPQSLHFCNELHEILLVVLKVLISPHKMNRNNILIAILFNSSHNEYILVDALW